MFSAVVFIFLLLVFKNVTTMLQDHYMTVCGQRVAAQMDRFSQVNSVFCLV